MKKINIERVAGRAVIGVDALTYCNTKYHAPYLARIDARGEMDWQEKTYIGSGKGREVFYVVEELRAGDLIQAAGGSGGNTYPFKGRVVAIDAETLQVEDVAEREWSNLVADRKAGKSIAKPTDSPLADQTDDELISALASRGYSVSKAQEHQ